MALSVLKHDCIDRSRIFDSLRAIGYRLFHYRVVAVDFYVFNMEVDLVHSWISKIYGLLTGFSSKVVRHKCLSALVTIQLASLLIISGCISRPDWFVGTGGKYNEAHLELIRGRSADLDKAIGSLQTVVQADPTYKDTLTLLGKAYYRKGRYSDAYSITQRALAVNKDDEIAWLVYGLAQLRVGENAKGIETIKGGLTLFGKAMREGYRGYPAWDLRGTVRASLNRAVFQALKGLEERESLIQITEQLLTRVDEEEWAQRHDKVVDKVMSDG
jgi:tetratricopeptide (TPR) repeat protein